MNLFSKKKISAKSYDKETQIPVIRASICNGEQVAGFRNIHTGRFEEVMLIKERTDLDHLKEAYGIVDEIDKIY